LCGKNDKTKENRVKKNKKKKREQTESKSNYAGGKKGEETKVGVLRWWTPKSQKVQGFEQKMGGHMRRRLGLQWGDLRASKRSYARLKREGGLSGKERVGGRLVRLVIRERGC